jgi:hypothetical protein
MARIKLALPVDDMFGSVSASTYSHTRSYLVLKTKSYPGSKHPFTPSQLQINRRNFFKASIISWKTLTPGQVEAWCNLAGTIRQNNRFDESYFAAGFNLYLELMQNMQMLGRAIYLDAPVKPSVIQLNSFTATVISTPSFNATLSFAGQSTDPNVFTEIYSTPSLTPARNYVKSFYRYIGFIPSNTTDTFDCTSLYSSVFPNPTPNKKIFFKLIAIDSNTGFSSNVITNFCIVDA